MSWVEVDGAGWRWVHGLVIFIKNFKESKKLKELEIVSTCNLYIFLGIAKVADFELKNADVSRTKGLCYVIYKLFGSSLGKV